MLIWNICVARTIKKYFYTWKNIKLPLNDSTVQKINELIFYLGKHSFV